VPRTCRTCNKEKSAAEFYRDYGCADGLNIDCADCCRDAAARDRREKPAIGRTASRKWKTINPDKAKQDIAEYRAANRERISQKSREWRRANKKRLQSKERRRLVRNRAQICAKNARRRASQRKATPPWLTAIQIAQIAEFYEIAAARTVQTNIVHHVDHVHPLLGKNFRGLHVPWNLQVLTDDENRRKGAQFVEDAA